MANRRGDSSMNGARQRKRAMIVVSRPYWLTFYAKDARKAAWVVVAAYESSC
jgi:hypothetical protein